MINIIVGAYKAVSSIISGAVMKADAKANAAEKMRKEQQRALGTALIQSENQEKLADYSSNQQKRNLVYGLVFLLLAIVVFLYYKSKKD